MRTVYDKEPFPTDAVQFVTPGRRVRRAAHYQANPTDTMFGIGLSLNNPAAVDKSCWVGDNLLGYTLMLVRDETKLMEITTDRLCKTKSVYVHNKCIILGPYFTVPLI